MMDCPDLSVLADVEAAADYRAIALLEHLRTCGECRAAMRDIETVNDALSVATSLDEQRVDSIMAGLRADGHTERATRPRALYAAAVFVLALASTFGLALASSLVSPEPPSSWTVVVFTVVATLFLIRMTAPRPG